MRARPDDGGSPSPSFATKLFIENLRAVDRKVLVRQERPHLPVGEQLGQKLARHLSPKQPVAVLGEHRRNPYYAIRRLVELGLKRKGER
jgi:hypothetical protein